MTTHRKPSVTIATPTSGRCLQKNAECVHALIEKLRSLDWHVDRVVLSGCSIISYARSIIATEFYQRKETEILFWFDDDQLVEIDEMVSMLSRCLTTKGIIGGVCVTKTPAALMNIKVLEGTKKLGFLRGGDIHEIESIGTGVCAVHYDVFNTMVVSGDTQPCADNKGRTMFPFYRDGVHGGKFYGEDMDFCRRARLLHHRVWADTRMRTWHIGDYAYTLEDTQPSKRYESMDINFSSDPEMVQNQAGEANG